jgi:plastocyanin
MTKLLALGCCVLAFALLAAGCGSSNNGGGGGGGTKTSAPAKPKSKPGGKTVGVTEKNIAFNPKTLTVAKGTTVRWTNDDSVNHDVTKTGGPGPDFSSGQGNLAKGATYQQTLKTPGTIKYQCTVHPGMTGSITVK